MRPTLFGVRFQATSKLDRLIVFEDYVRELEKKEEVAKAAEREERRRQEHSHPRARGSPVFVLVFHTSLPPPGKLSGGYS